MIFILSHATARQRAIDAVRDAPEGYVVRITQPKRSLSQNDRLHACLQELAGKEWGGKPRSREEWKTILVSAHAVATGREAEIVTGIEGELVNLRESTSAMSRERASSLIAYVEAFATQMDA